jgi:hypothetical protein
MMILVVPIEEGSTPPMARSLLAKQKGVTKNKKLRA